jgi:hypothetical protein
VYTVASLRGNEGFKASLLVGERFGELPLHEESCIPYGANEGFKASLLVGERFGERFRVY